MKVTYKRVINIIVLGVLATSFSYAFAHADTTAKGNLAANFSITEVMKEAAKGITETFTGKSSETETVTDAPSASRKATAPQAANTIQAQVVSEETSEDLKVEVEDKNVCEYFDSTVLNVLNLSASSADTKQKIEKVEETIADETALRDSILGSVKDLLGLQKKDKVIFREMKKDISDAKSYYFNIDEKLSETEKYLDENYCENVKLEEAKKVDTDTQNMVDDEEVYRKQLVASLKEKMKILQDGVKEAKK